mmetsp:Transcript_16950/g.38777  ORF Transcript_16950/g.38777 Transcript_16950/m.38777 type:complete len:220 (+) Transcript_16950:222-881(+)
MAPSTHEMHPRRSELPLNCIHSKISPSPRSVGTCAEAAQIRTRHTTPDHTAIWRDRGRRISAANTRVHREGRMQARCMRDLGRDDLIGGEGDDGLYLGYLLHREGDVEQLGESNYARHLLGCGQCDGHAASAAAPRAPRQVQVPRCSGRRREHERVAQRQVKASPAAYQRGVGEISAKSRRGVGEIRTRYRRAIGELSCGLSCGRDIGELSCGRAVGEI